jgi:NADH-quinone oxidoreductase subunit L
MLFGLPHYLILVIPLAGSLLVPLIGRFNPKLRDWTPSILMGITMAFCWSLLFEIDAPNPTYAWINVPGVLEVRFEMLLDPLSVIMGVLASTLCFLIYVYSTEYMAHDEDRDRFYFLMLAFGGGMLTLVLSNNLLIGFIGWEIMGFCSYGLIGFWNDRRNPPEKDPTGIESTNPLLHFETEGAYNTHCGTKAFIVTRIGDAFMLGGILLLFAFTGSFLFTDMAANINNWWGIMSSLGLLLPALLLVFMGAIGKSGQAPLQVWLPEAMAGPTSVSALIHAATMVKAGVYITARFLLTMVEAAGTHSGDSGGTMAIPLQAFGSDSAMIFFLVVAGIGAITAFMTATMGMVSNELKQVLAFSTLSQLGYMILALGASGLLMHYETAYLSSLMHIISHGAFKALLFLAAGGVIHAVHTKYLSNMGGLKKYMPKTLVVVWIGVLSLSGIPPFSGFWSKDSIIEHTFELAQHNPWGIVFFGLAVMAAACTVFYSIRLVGLTFYGNPRTEIHADDEHEEEHHPISDPGPAMMFPLYVLAGFTVLAFVVFPFVESIALRSGEPWNVIFWNMLLAKFTLPGLLPLALTLGALALGGIPALIIYIRRADTPNALIPESGPLRRLYNFLRRRWLINDFYYWVLNGFMRIADSYRVRVDDHIIDGIDFKSASAAQTLSGKIRWFDDNVVDGFAEGVSTRSVDASEAGLKTQTGRINDYVGVFIFGLGLLAVLIVVALGVI